MFLTISTHVYVDNQNCILVLIQLKVYAILNSTKSLKTRWHRVHTDINTIIRFLAGKYVSLEVDIKLR